MYQVSFLSKCYACSSSRFNGVDWMYLLSIDVHLLIMYCCFSDEAFFKFSEVTKTLSDSLNDLVSSYDLETIQ